MSWQDEPNGRKYVAITTKAVGDLTPDDFAFLRAEDPAVAAERSAAYDKWYEAQRAQACDVKHALAAAPRAGVLAIGKDEDLDDWIKKHADAPAPMYVIGVLLDTIKQTNDARKADVAALEQRIKDLEARPAAAMPYKGVWKNHETYEAGALVTFDGSMWAAVEASTGRRPPGPSWQLCVRRGTDGKHAPGA